MRAASHHTLAVYASVGLGLQPQLPSASPTPTPSVVWAQVAGASRREAAGCSPLPVLLSAQVEALWVGEHLVSSDACPPWLLLLSPAQHLVLIRTRASVACVVHAAVRLEGRMKKEPCELPCWPVAEIRLREESVRAALWFPLHGRAGGSADRRSWGSA